MVSCSAFLMCIWQPVKGAVLACVGETAAQCLTPLRDWFVSAARRLIWGDPPEPPVPVAPISAPGNQGQSDLQNIESAMGEEGVGLIGVHGIGGIGKTTLLEKVHKKFRPRSAVGAGAFDVVIFVFVSKHPSILKIQKLIGDHLGLPLSAEDAGPSSQAEDQRVAISEDLSGRRFLLLLDDVWDELNLKLVGIPPPTAQNKCKIILTSRWKDVCSDMGAQRIIEVKGLREPESSDLFKRNVVGAIKINLENPQIERLARVVVQRCGGVPLALIILGRSMARSTSVEAWEEAVRALKESVDGLPEPKPEEKVFSLLKFSFERLRDDTTKRCFIFCCDQLPQNKISEALLVNSWLFYMDCSAVARRGTGEHAIPELISAGLLERTEGAYCSEYFLKMHDVVRDLGRRLTSQRRQLVLHSRSDIEEDGDRDTIDTLLLDRRLEEDRRRSSKPTARLKLEARGKRPQGKKRYADDVSCDREITPGYDSF